MGIDVELWRARIGTFNGGKGSRKLRALLAFRRLYLRDPVAWATGEATNCTPVAVQASIACLSLWLILRFLGSCWNKIKSTYPTKFNGGLSYHWSKDPKAPVSITLSIAVVVAIAVLLHSLTILLLRAGDVELNPGPIMSTPLTLANLHQVHTKLCGARTKWYEIGQCLSVDNETLRSIRGDREFRDDGARLNEMLDCRLNSRVHLTWATLCGCLRHPTVARDDLANDIEEKLKGEETTICKQFEANVTFKSSPAIVKKFPSFNHDRLSEEEIKSRLRVLEKESNEMDFKFNALSSSICQSLKEGNVLKDRLLTCLMGLKVMQPCFQGKKQRIFRKQRRKLEKCQSVDEVWWIISDYFSFFNYKLLKHIVNSLGTKEDEEKVATYEQDFHTYAKRLLSESPSQFGSRVPEDSTDLIVKLDSSYDDCTLCYLEELEMKLSDIFQLEHGVMRLCHVLPGCYELTFEVPSFVESTVFPLSPDQEDALKALGVIRLRCGDYAYPSEDEDDPYDKGSDSDPDHDPPDSGRGTFTTEHTGTGTSKSRRSEGTTSSVVGPDEYQPTENKIIKHVSAHSLAVRDGDSMKAMVSMSNFLANRDKHLSMEFNTKHNPPLHVAAYEGNLTAVKRCIEVEGCDPMQLNEHGCTALHIATRYRHLNVIKYLVEEVGLSAAIVLESKVGYSPLHFAIMTENVPLVKYFFNSVQIDPMYLDGVKQTPLHYACRVGNLIIVEYLINEAQKYQSIESVVNIQTPDNTSLLHFAALSGSLEVVKLLTEKFDVSPNKRNTMCNSRGHTPLHFAASRGHTDIVRFLTINKKCDPAIKTSNYLGYTALHLAAQYGFLSTVEFLIKHFKGLGELVDSNKWTPLHHAVHSGNLAVIKLLTLNNPASIFSRDKCGDTPLHVATLDVRSIHSKMDLKPFDSSHNTEKDQLAIIKFLTVERQCNPMCKNILGDTPLHNAAMSTYLQVVTFLINQLHCDPTITNETGQTPLDCATLYGRKNIVEFLTSLSQCDPMCKDNEAMPIDSKTARHLMKAGNTKYTSTLPIACSSPLHRAAEQGTILTVRDLLQKYTPDYLDSLDRVPLHYAAMGGRLVIIKYLVLSNADPLSEDVFHNLPLHYAAALGHLDIVKFLVNIGCPYTTRGVLNMTPTEMTTAGGHEEVVEYLDTVQSHLS